MKNTIKRTVTGLIYQGQRALPGVQANLAPLGYSAAQGETFNNRIVDLTGMRDAHGAAKVTVSTCRLAQRVTIAAARAAAMLARDMLKPFLGREHSVPWAQAGFDRNLAVADDAAGLLRNVQGLKAYFTAHPEHENAALNITAEQFSTLATDLMTRTTALDVANAALVTLTVDRDAKAELVREELQLLLSKLRVSFDPFASMWETVGFNRPGFRSIPAIPANLVATLVGTNSAAMSWDPAQRAERYYIWKKVVGVDPELVLVETRSELDFVLEGLPRHATVELAISAVNSGGESAKSQVVTIVTQ